MSTEASKYLKLNSLLDQTSLYSKFLSEQIPERHKKFMGEEVEVDANDMEVQGPEEQGSAKRRKTGGRKTPTKKASSKGKKGADEIDRLSQLLKGGKLRPYQVNGVEWLISLNQNGLNGILADDMGLGKTIQIISFLAYLWSQEVKGPFLIAGPLSTVHNWVNEFKKWAPQIPVQLYHGSKEERLTMRKGWGAPGTKDFPAIITSYEVCLKDKTFLRNYDWKVLCVDEGHRLKNMECQLIKALKEYKSQNRVLLTGTPLQNNLRELWSLLNFLLPAVFDSLERFESWFNFDTSTIEDEEGQQDLIKQERENQVVSKLHEILRPFVLRRTKRDVLAKELPQKLEYVLYTPLTKVQKHYYQAVLERNATALFDNKNQSLNNILMQLRKVCNHPYLLREPEDESGNLSTDDRIIEWCGKMKLLDAMLQKLKQNGHKVLIFSQMTAVLDIIQDYCDYREYNCCRIDGSTDCNKRQEQIKEYNDPDCQKFVFLLSTRAGGLGINLTSADTVIIYDSDWNPHQDDQAQDRCHRIGQKNNVIVYRFITPASVEVQMLKRANSKRKLEQLVIGKANLKDRNNKMMVKKGNKQDRVKDEMIGNLLNLFDANEAATKQREEEEKKAKKEKGETELEKINPYVDGLLKPSVLQMLLNRKTQPTEDGVQRGFAVVKPNSNYRDLFSFS